MTTLTCKHKFWICRIATWISGILVFIFLSKMDEDFEIWGVDVYMGLAVLFGFAWCSLSRSLSDLKYTMDFRYREKNDV